MFTEYANKMEYMLQHEIQINVAVHFFIHITAEVSKSLHHKSSAQAFLHP